MRKHRSLTAISTAVVLMIAPFVGNVVVAPAASAATITTPGPIHLGDTVSGELTVATGFDDYTFSLPAPGALAYFHPTDHTCNCKWALTGPNGTVFSQALSSGDIDASSLPAGSYALRVSGNGTDVGTYSFDLTA